MNKKGFTLIEIIVCIIILAIIGVSSFVGIKTLTKNVRISNLNQITDRALQAAEVYIETNKETYNQLYNKKNGVVIPLKVLVNEGLLDLKGTKLDDTDIEKEYVITALTDKEENPTNGCVDVRTEASWMTESSAPIYICTNNTESSDTAGNSIYIGGNYSNHEATEGNRKWITDYTRNYVTYNNQVYRLLYIDYDDSLVLYTPENTFGDVFGENTQETYSDQDTSLSSDSIGILYNKVTTSACNENKTTCDNSRELKIGIFKSSSGCYNQNKNEEIDNNDYDFYLTGTVPNVKYYYGHITNSTGPTSTSSFSGSDMIAHKRITNENKEQYITLNDYHTLYSEGGEPSFIQNSNTRNENLYEATGFDMWGRVTQTNQLYYLKGKKIQLKPCMKIFEGIGTNITPYKIINMC